MRSLLRGIVRGVSCEESLARSLSTLGVSHCEESLVARSHLLLLLRGVSRKESRKESHRNESHRSQGVGCCEESLVARSLLSQESLVRSLS